MEELKAIPTCKLVEELESREGVSVQMVDVNEPFSVFVDGEQKSFKEAFGFEVNTGPAIILAVID